MPENGVYSFGVFELDSRTRELKKRGVRIKLQDQPVRILLMLAQHPGEVVTREQIQSELWPAGTYVDYENAINSSVRKLREALGDTPANPRFVETLSRRGYRLLVPVSRDGAIEPPDEPRRRWPIWAGAGVLLLLAIAAVLVSRRQSSIKAELPPAVPLTSYPGLVCCPSFAPDGTRVAFAWTGPKGAGSHIFVKLIGEGEPVALTTGEGQDKWPAWSPDGRSIAFERHADGRASVVVKPAMGGPEREIAHLGTGDRTVFSSISWSTDGKSLFAVDGGPETAATWITRVSVEAGEKVRMTFPPSPYRDEAPAVSPDGGRVAFTRGAGYGMNVYIVALPETGSQGGAPRQITSDPMPIIESLGWTPDGRYLVFSATRGGGRALWQVSAEGSSRPVLLTGGGENSHDVAISKQGRLIYSTTIEPRRLWRLPIAVDSKIAAARFLPSTRDDFLPQYSPDGKRVAFESNRSGDQEIWVSDADGRAPEQLTFLHGWSGTPRWSPGGDRIAFDSNGTGRWEIFVIGSGGGKPVQLTGYRGLAAIPSWSRDGKWIYFCSDKTGRGEIWKIPAVGGRAVQVTRNGGAVGYEAAGGKELYFTKSGTVYVERENRLWRMPLPDGAEEQVAGRVAGRNFETAASGAYFIEESPSGAALRFLRYGTRSAETIAALGGTDYFGITISPDERVALYSRREVTHSELMLAEGFGQKHAP